MDLHPRQFVRVDVRTLEDEVGQERPVDRHFSIDPRTVTLDRLKQLVAKALDIRGEFCVLFLKRDSGREGAVVPLSCDWDLEGVLSEETRHLHLALRLLPREPGLEEWDIICPVDVPVEAPYYYSGEKESFLEQVFHLGPSRLPLTESEFLCLRECPGPLRHALYRAGGADPRLRPWLWLHLVDAYPTERECCQRDREDFVNCKAEEYYALRDAWQKLMMEKNKGAAVLREITCLVQKDVRRTDPLLDLDERALYNVLTTYAVHHPSVSYRQGMSDLLSPLLQVMRTEAGTYLAFCGLMQRMRHNFRRDGRSMQLKFRHLRHLLRLHDPPLHRHLKRVGALELPFCYRWLLLDLKREFPYRDIPMLTEVLWSTLPPLPSEEGVALYEARLMLEPVRNNRMRTMTTFRGNSSLIRSVTREEEEEVDEGSSLSQEEELEQSSFPLRRCRRRTRTEVVINPSSSEGHRWHSSCDSNYESNCTDDDDEDPPSIRDDCSSESCTSSFGQDSAHPSTLTDDSEEENPPLDDGEDLSPLLPPPHRLGDGKPFLLFLCLALMMEHRDQILSRGMDAGEIGIHFDALMRRHQLDRVLLRARKIFEEYLRMGWTDD